MIIIYNTHICDRSESKLSQIRVLVIHPTYCEGCTRKGIFYITEVNVSRRSCQLVQWLSFCSEATSIEPETLPNILMNYLSNIRDYLEATACILSFRFASNHGGHPLLIGLSSEFLDYLSYSISPFHIGYRISRVKMAHALIIHSLMANARFFLFFSVSVEMNLNCIQVSCLADAFHCPRKNLLFF